MPAAPPDASTFPFEQADLCVKCGLCLPHCPTYGESHHEGDSPRGRIALMQGLASGALMVSPALEAHLDGCLGCRACERVCPAKVPYGLLIDEGRALLARQQPARTRMTRIAGALLSSSLGLHLLALGLWLYRRTGLQWLLRRSGLLGHGRLARLESLVPECSRHSTAPVPVAGGAKRVSLFTGCVGRLLDDETFAAARVLFARLGVRVDTPAGQTCCGAIHQHGGLPEAAAISADRNIRAFDQSDRVVHCASGCGATLVDYARLSEDPGAAALVDKLDDVCAALLRHWSADLRLRPLPARVAVHLPCTQRNVLGGDEAILALLRKIPDIELVTLDETQRCCGAAGMHFVSHPEAADQLLEPKLRNAGRLAPSYIVSSNIGCTLHLAGGLRRRGMPAPEILHPVALLARQLPA